MSMEPSISGQQAAIAWQRSSGPELLSRFVQAFNWPRVGPKPATGRSPNEAATRITALGTHEFIVRDEPMAVGNSGVTVQVSDLYLIPGDRTVSVGGQRYMSPALTRMGAATVTGTSGKDIISVSQDARGNTILEVDHAGQTRTVDLGRIAALTLHGAGEDDTITVDVKKYFGGITVYGGSGDDNVNVRAGYSLKRGVALSGGTGNDTLTVSGKALAVLMEGGAGADRLSALLVEGEMGLIRRISGDQGNDTIYGSPGKDVLAGGNQHDFIIGGAGSDTILGGSGEDVLYAGDGADFVWAGAGNDTIHGGQGDDRIWGESDDDILMGAGGGDNLHGGPGADALYGGSAEDEIATTTGTGNLVSRGDLNTLSGGAGSDTFAPSSNSPGDIVAYTDTGNYLLDYDSDLDILI